MVEIEITYEGSLRTKATHCPSLSQIETDAPVDNQGRGERFSPTDLVASAAASCMLTVMGIVAERRGISLKGSSAKVEKHMVNEPVRRIGKLVINIFLPKGISPENRTLLERTASTCPVKKSLHPDVEIITTFNY